MPMSIGLGTGLHHGASAGTGQYVTSHSISDDTHDGREAYDVGSGLPVAYVSNITRVGDFGGIEEIAAWHFPSVDVPYNAEIVSATITVSVTVTNGTYAFTLAAEDSDDADVPSETNWPSSWSMTAATVAVNADGTTGARSINVTAIVEELTTRAGWIDGNAMNFRLRDPSWSAATGNRLQFADYPAPGCARLSITYRRPELIWARLDGTADMSLAGALFPDCQYITCVFNARFDRLAAKFLFSGKWPAVASHAAVSLSNAGSDINYDLFFIDSGLSVFLADEWVISNKLTAPEYAFAWEGETIYCHLIADTVTGEIKTYINGALFEHETGLPTGTFDFSGATQWYMFRNIFDGTGTTRYVGLIERLWIGCGTTSAYFVDDPELFYKNGAPTDLGADGTRGGRLPAPQLFFGGRQTIADWNTGNNQGTGSNFTVTGTIYAPGDIADDTTPSAAPSWTTLTGQAISTVVRCAVASTVTGFNVPVPISVSNGEYLIGDPSGTTTDWRTAPALYAGGNIYVRHTTAATPLTQTTTTVTVGGLSGTFTTETA